MSLSMSSPVSSGINQRASIIPGTDGCVVVFSVFQIVNRKSGLSYIDVSGLFRSRSRAPLYQFFSFYSRFSSIGNPKGLLKVEGIGFGNVSNEHSVLNFIEKSFFGC